MDASTVLYCKAASGHMLPRQCFCCCYAPRHPPTIRHTTVRRAHLPKEVHKRGAPGYEARLPCRLTEGCAASHVAGRHITCPMSACVDAATTTHNSPSSSLQQVCGPVLLLVKGVSYGNIPACPLQALQPRYSISMPHPAPAANRDRTPAVAGATAAAPLRVVVGAGDADAAGSVTLPSAAGLLVAAPSAAALAALSAAALRWYSTIVALLEGGARMLSIRYTTQVGV